MRVRTKSFCEDTLTRWKNVSASKLVRLSDDSA